MTLDWILLGCTSTTKDLDSRFTSGSLPDSSVLCWRRLPHSEGGFKGKSGPFIQRSFRMNAFAEVPREASSAGLDLDSTYLL